MKSVSSSISKMIFTGTCLFVFLTTSPGHSAETLQKLRVAYAAMTAGLRDPLACQRSGDIPAPRLRR